MYRFIKRTGIFSLVSVFILLGPPYLNSPLDRNGPYLDVYHRLDLQNNQSEIIFVGSSTLAFGLQEEQLLDQDIDFISIGAHAGVGPSYSLGLMNMIDNAENQMVILSPVPAWLFNPNESPELPKVIAHSGMSLAEAIQSYGLAVSLLAKTQSFVDRFKWFSMYPKRSIEMKEFQWSCDIFTSRGVIKSECKQKSIFQSKSVSGQLETDTSKSLDVEFWMDKKQQCTHVLPPPMRQTEFNKTLEQALQDLCELNQWPLLLEMNEVVFPDSLFCDKSHLNANGSVLYTEQVAAAIKRIRN